MPGPFGLVPDILGRNGKAAAGEVRQGYIGVKRIGEDHVPVSGRAFGGIADEEKRGGGGVVAPFVAAPGFHIGQEAPVARALRVPETPVSVRDEGAPVKNLGLKQFPATKRRPVEESVDGLAASGQARFEGGCRFIVKRGDEGEGAGRMGEEDGPQGRVAQGRRAYPAEKVRTVRKDAQGDLRDGRIRGPQPAANFSDHAIVKIILPRRGPPAPQLTGAGEYG